MHDALYRPATDHIDPTTPGGITALLDFHRATFGDARMDGTTTATGTTTTTATTGVDGDKDRGFPEGTPIAEMTTEQQVAYWRYHARRHEQAYKALGDVPELQRKAAEADRLRAQTQTDQEKALDAAREEGRKAAAAELRPRLVEAALRGAATGLTKDQVDTLIAGANPDAFLTTDLAVDAEKVNAYVALVKPPAPDPRAGLFDTGAGRRPSAAPTGVAAGRELFAARHTPKNNPS